MWKYFNLGTYHPILYIPTPPGPAQILTLVRGKMRRMLSMKPLIHHIASEWITSSIKKIPILSHIDDTLSLHVEASHWLVTAFDWMTKIILCIAVFVVQLEERLLPATVIRGSNPVIGKFCFLSTVLRRWKYKIKRPDNGHYKGLFCV